MHTANEMCNNDELEIEKFEFSLMFELFNALIGNAIIVNAFRLILFKCCLFLFMNFTYNTIHDNYTSHFVCMLVCVCDNMNKKK